MAEVRGDYRMSHMTPTKLAQSFVAVGAFWLVMTYRVASTLSRMRVPVIPSLLMTVAQVIWGAELSHRARIGPGLAIAHAPGIVIGAEVVAGKHLFVLQGVTIASGARIGDDVVICANAVIAGPVCIGDRVEIGAGCVVGNDVPADYFVRVPAAVLKPALRPTRFRRLPSD